MNANLVKVQNLLGERFGKDYFFVSVTLDPKVDTPERLKKYGEWFGTKPGWTFCTGDFDEIERLRHALGVYDPDPIIDADKTQHAGIAVIGDDRIDRWTGVPALLNPKRIHEALLRLQLTNRAREPEGVSTLVSTLPAEWYQPSGDKPATRE